MSTKYFILKHVYNKKNWLFG